MKIPKTLLQAIRYFSDPQVCEDYMREIRWAGKTIGWFMDFKNWLDLYAVQLSLTYIMKGKIMEKQEIANIKAFVEKMDEAGRAAFLMGLAKKDRKELLKAYFNLED